MKCESRFCDKEIDMGNCYSYTSGERRLVRWCNVKCYSAHIGRFQEADKSVTECENGIQ